MTWSCSVFPLLPSEHLWTVVHRNGSPTQIVSYRSICGPELIAWRRHCGRNCRSERLPNKRACLKVFSNRQICVKWTYWLPAAERHFFALAVARHQHQSYRLRRRLTIVSKNIMVNHELKMGDATLLFQQQRISNNNMPTTISVWMWIWAERTWLNHSATFARCKRRQTQPGALAVRILAEILKKCWELCPVMQLFDVALKQPNWPWPCQVSHLAIAEAP